MNRIFEDTFSLDYVEVCIIIINAHCGHITFIILTADWQHHAVDDASSRDHSRAPSRPAPPHGLRLVKMASIMEGPLSKWTNVMKGWQYRWFVLDYNAGLLSYYTVSRFPDFFILVLYYRWTGHLKLSLLVRAQVRCGPAVCQELGVSAGRPGRFWKDGFSRRPIAVLLSHWLTNWRHPLHTSAKILLAG